MNFYNYFESCLYSAAPTMWNTLPNKNIKLDKSKLTQTDPCDAVLCRIAHNAVQKAKKRKKITPVDYVVHASGILSRLN